MTTSISLLFPPGRVVQGDLYKAQDKDGDGKPLIVKSGPHQGKATVKYFFAVAIPKSPGAQHWASEEWGAKLWALGHSTWPNGQAQAPTFAWKIEDGDSGIPNKKGKKNCDRPGFPGNWVVNFSSGFAPRIFNSDGTAPLTEPGAVKPGYWVQVFATADSNRSDLNPGLFINHSMVAFAGYGEEIHVGPDAAAVGFGQGPKPAGILAAPVGGMAAPPAPAPAPAYAPSTAYTPTPALAYVAPALPAGAQAAPVAPTAVMPAPAFIAPPALPAAPTGPQMTAKANGATHAAMRAAGWTDDLMRQHGYMV